MLKKLTNNMGLKLLSLALSVGIWLIVVNIDDPVVTRRFYNIEVEPQNVSVITDEGKVYDVLENSDSITITVRAKRSILEDMSSADFKATANMQEMDLRFGLVPIRVDALRYANQIEEIDPAIRNMKVSIDDFKTKQFAINAIVKGTPAEGCAVGGITVFPNVVKVSGPATTVDKISKVSVDADIENMSSDLDLVATPKFFDSDGKILESAKLTLNVEEIRVQVSMLETKRVELKFDTTGTPGEGYEYTGTDCEPKSVKIKSDPQTLASVDSIDIPASELNLDQVTENIEKIVDISKYLPENVSLVDADDGKVAVTVHIAPYQEKTVEVPLSAIRARNQDSRLQLKYQSQAPIVLKVRGPKEAIDSLRSQDITGWIDLQGLSEGNHNLEISFIVPEGIICRDKITVGVTLTAVSADSGGSSQSSSSNSGGSASSGSGGDSSPGSSSSGSSDSIPTGGQSGGSSSSASSSSGADSDDTSR